MDINQIRREVKWYTDEVVLNEREVKALEAKLTDAKRKVEDNKRKLEAYKRDLAHAEAQERSKQR